MGKRILEAEAFQPDAKPFLGDDLGHQRSEPADDGVVFQRDDTLLAARRLEQAVAVERLQRRGV
ncbi:hypothetical protein D3C87_2056140 [compost metagenome]